MTKTAPDIAINRLPAAIVLGFGTLISHGFGLALVPAMLPRVADDFGVGYGALGAALAVGLVAYSLGALSTGRIMGRIASRGLLIGTYAASACGLLLAGAADSTSLLAAAAIVMGFAAPVSWATTLHVAGATTVAAQRASVMASASGGAALGVLINGVFVQTSDSIHSWRVSFVIAAALAIIPIVGCLLVYRNPIARPSARRGSQRSGYRRVLQARAGRVVVLSSLVVGLTGFPFSVFLTATAIDEFHASSFNAGLLWWLIGILGAAGAPLLGRYSDRTSPLRALTVLAVSYLVGLAVLLAAWGYVGLLVASIGFAILNYPVWGIVGALANDHFDSGLAVRAISLGLIGASLTGAVGNAVAGAWIDSSGSFRSSVLIMALITAALVGWFWKLTQDNGLMASDRTTGDANTPPTGSGVADL